MDRLHVKYLLVGGGVCSSAAAQAIRELDKDGSLLLVGMENTRPYHRPPLSKEFLRGEKKRAELFTLPAQWFADNHVQLHSAQRATHLDAARRAIQLDNGEEVSFDRLLLATGASANHLQIEGAQLPNVYTLRNLADADRLHHAIEKAKAEGRPHERGRGRAAVIGAGYLGVELAASLTQLGLTVDLIESGPYPWRRFAGESTGRFLVRYLEKHGIAVHLAASPKQLEGDGRVQRIAFNDGSSLPCDLVVAAVGMSVNKDLLRGTPIAAEQSILCDDHCRTSIPDIYAAGDCAALFDPLFGKFRRLDHWDNAIVTGTLAGHNMAGADEAYRTVNYFFSDVFALSLSGWGEARQVERRLLRGTPSVESPDFVEIGIAADGRIAQVLAVNHGGDDERLKSLVARRVAVDGNEEQLKDPAGALP